MQYARVSNVVRIYVRSIRRIMPWDLTLGDNWWEPPSTMCVCDTVGYVAVGFQKWTATPYYTMGKLER